MPQLLAVAIGSCILWFAFRWVRREAARVDSAISRAERRISRNRRGATRSLRLDPVSGFYRPAE